MGNGSTRPILANSGAISTVYYLDSPFIRFVLYV
jgi:hypothetical protein